MEYLAIVIALGLGYFVGLMQNGINIKHSQPEIAEDEDGKPVYNESVTTMEQDYRKWIEQNREV